VNYDGLYNATSGSKKETFYPSSSGSDQKLTKANNDISMKRQLDVIPSNMKYSKTSQVHGSTGKCTLEHKQDSL